MVGYTYPPNVPWGMKGPMGVKFFTQFFTHNFDINIVHRELTLYTIEIHIFRLLHFMHMNICLKGISVNHNVALQNISLSNRVANNTIPTRELTLNGT